MARSTLAVVESPVWGKGVIDAGFEQVDQALGDLFAIAEDTYLYVLNGEGGAQAIVVTLNLPATRHTANAIALKTLTIQDGKMGVFGPFPVAAYKQADGKVWVDYDVNTTVATTAAVIHGNKTPGF